MYNISIYNDVEYGNHLPGVTNYHESVSKEMTLNVVCTY